MTEPKHGAMPADDRVLASRLAGGDTGEPPEQHPQLTPDEDRDQRGGDPDGPGTDPVGSRSTPDDPELKKRIHAWVSDHKPPSRQDGLWPYLLIRAYPGDTGIRNPPVGTFWESPDVRVVEGVVTDPSQGTPTLHPQPGVAHTVFVHVWNLGRLPAVGVHVRVWWANPSFSFDAGSPEPPHFIGGTTVDLADRSSPECHALVPIPGAWTPIVENGGHECLLAVATQVLDPGGGGFAAATDRHVGQRNITLAGPDVDLSPLLNRLGAVLPVGADLQLMHGGAQVAPILLAHKLVAGATVELPQTRQIVLPVGGEQPGGGALGQLGAVVGTAAGRQVVTAERLAPALMMTASAHPATAVLDRSALLTAGRAMPGAGGPVNVGPGLALPPLTLSPARAVVTALGVSDLRAATIARAVSATSGDGNLLRFQAVRDGVVVGGYSVIVKDQ